MAAVVCALAYSRWRCSARSASAASSGRATSQLTIVAVVAFAAIVDPVGVYLARALHIQLGVPWKFFTDAGLAGLPTG